MADFFPLSLAFSSPPSRVHNETRWKLSVPQYQPLLTSATSRSQLRLYQSKGHASDCCLLPGSRYMYASILFYCFLPFTDDQPWRALFLNYSNLAIAFLLPHSPFWNNMSLKTTTKIKTKKPKQKQKNPTKTKTNTLKVSGQISLSPCSKTTSEQQTAQLPKGISYLFY